MREGTSIEEFAHRLDNVCEVLDNLIITHGRSMQQTRFASLWQEADNVLQANRKAFDVNTTQVNSD